MTVNRKRGQRSTSPTIGVVIISGGLLVQRFFDKGDHCMNQPWLTTRDWPVEALLSKLATGWLVSRRRTLRDARRKPRSIAERRKPKQFTLRPVAAVIFQISTGLMISHSRRALLH